MTLKCAHCGRGINVPDAARGKTLKCPNCQKPLSVPAAVAAVHRSDGTSAPAKAEGAALKQGTVLGRYRIERLIGRGDLAAVYQAAEVQTRRAVALKVFVPRLAGSKAFVERLECEAQALAKLSHPNIVRALEAGVQAGTCYLATEYVEGQSLRARLRRHGPLPHVAAAVRLLDQVAAGLDAAHGRSLLHRDVRPENVFIASDGTAKLADFGIARFAADPEGRGLPTLSPARPRLAPYLAPELAQDALSVDYRADIYALGVLLYEVLTGKLPVGEFTPASEAVEGVPQAVDGVICGALADQPEQRFKDAAQFRAMLQMAISQPDAPKGGKRLAASVGDWVRGNLRTVACWGAAVVGIVVVALIARAFYPDVVKAWDDWSGSGKSGRVGKRDPSAAAKTGSSVLSYQEQAQAERREREAGRLVELARTKAREDNWPAALGLLDDLAARFATTQVCSTNKETLRDLRDKALAEVKARSAAFQAKTGVELPIKGGAGEVPQGLLAVFYDGDDFGRFVRLERHPGPWFTWGADNPGAGAGERLSARYVGQVEVRELGQYMFRFVSEGGTRLYLDGKKVLDDWSAKEHRIRRLTLEPGKHAIWIEFKTGGAKASFVLHWSRNEYETAVEGKDCSWTPELWQRVCREPGRDPLVGLRPAVAGESDVAEVPTKTVKEAPPVPQDPVAKGLGVLRPLWAKRQYAEAAARAKALATDPEFAAAPDVAKHLAEDAQALVGFWKSVEAGADSLQLGESVRVCGIAGELEKVEGGSIFVRHGAVAIKKALTDLNGDEIVALARRAGAAKSGADHFRLALFWLFTARPDTAKGEAELALAEAGGVDVSLYRPRVEAPRVDPPKPTVPKVAVPKEVPTKEVLPADTTFDSAIKTAQTRLRMKDYRGLQQSVRFALRLKPPGEEASQRLDDLFASVVDAAVTAGKSFETDHARMLLGIGQSLRFESPEVEALSAWLTKSTEPFLVENFDAGLDRWHTNAGTWRVEEGHLVSGASKKEARLYLEKVMLPDYAFEFYVRPGGGTGTSHVGTVFRDNVFRRLLFEIHEEKSAFVAGGDGFFDGVGLYYLKDKGQYAGEAGKTLHVAVRCVTLDFECFVDGDLWARGATRDAEKGKVGLIAQGPEARFHGFRLYHVYPVPPMKLGGRSAP